MAHIPPSGVLAQWPAPNYVDPADRGPALIITTLVLIILGAVMVALRVYTRLTILRSYSPDDTLIIAALIAGIGHTGLLLVSHIDYHFGRHIWDIPKQNFEISLKLTMATQVTFAMACMLTKDSMLVLIRRLISNSSNIYRAAILAGIWVVSLQGIICCFVIIFQCNPIQQYWTFTMGPTNCIDEAANLTANGIITTVTDFVVVLLPIPLIWNLQLPMRQRLKAILLLSVGILACCAGIVRTYYITRLADVSDITWEAWPVSIASVVELNVGMMCACTPAIQPLIWKIFPQTRSHISNGSAFRTTDMTIGQSYRLDDRAARLGGRVLNKLDKGDAESQTEIFHCSSSDF